MPGCVPAIRVNSPSLPFAPCVCLPATRVDSSQSLHACDSVRALWLMPKIDTQGSVSVHHDRLVMAGASSKLCNRCASLSQHHRKSQASSVTHRWHVLVETMVGSSARESINPCHRCLLLPVCRSEQHVVCNALRAMSRAERLPRNMCRSAFASQRVSVCLRLPATSSFQRAM